MRVGLFKESKILLLWLNGVFYDLLIHTSCWSSSKFSFTENCKMCYWKAALKGWLVFPEWTKRDLGLTVLVLLFSPLAVMVMLPYRASLQGCHLGLCALGRTRLSSWGEDPWCPEMPLLEAAWTNSGFGPGPSCRAAPALWFRCNLGNIMQVIPFVSILPLPPFHTPTLRYGTVSPWSCVVKHLDPWCDMPGGDCGGLLLAVHLVSLTLAFRPLFWLIYVTLKCLYKLTFEGTKTYLQAKAQSCLSATWVIASLASDLELYRCQVHQV